MALPWKPDFERIPHEAGCYVYKDPQGTILYIGKAKDLRKRVTQYFQRDVDEKTAVMLERARDVEWIATKNEVDALILEARLIRQHKPHFNIDLKHNERYAFLALTNEAYPRLITVRKADAAKEVFGPFVDGTQRFELQRLARKLFRLRVCSTMPKRVCLYYHLGQCSGPCEGKISKDDYNKDVQRAKLFIIGKAPALLKELETSMQEASKLQHYEEAKRLRDTIGAVEHASTRKITAAQKQYDEDVVLCRKQDAHYLFLVMHVKKGIITQAEEFPVENSLVDTTAPLDDFIKSYYQTKNIPDELLLERELHDAAIVELLRFTKQHAQGGTQHSRIDITVPQHGPKRALLAVAVQNIEARMNKTQHILLKLQESLRLPGVPRVIDAFDNSHIQGTNVVSACVRYVNGQPSKKDYRKFIIKTVVGNDDFASMREAVGRRYGRIQREGGQMPELILIDGGKGQLSAAYDALRELGLAVPVIGLAKREEEVFVPGLPNPLPLDKNSDESLLLQRIRNEIHRFVITFHRARRAKSQVASKLDSVSGVGEKTKFALLKRFGTLDGILAASDEDLLAVVSQRQLVALRKMR